MTTSKQGASSSFYSTEQNFSSVNTNITDKSSFQIYLNRARESGLSAKHFQDLIKDRGLNPEWVIVNCRSMTAKEASERLSYPSKSPGIWLEGVNGYGQFKPDKPWKSNLDQKAPKYRTATKEEPDTILPKHPDHKNYWDDLSALKEECWQINGHPCLSVTEGVFKAIAGCSNGIPTVALAGVEMGLTSSKADPQGKRYLVEGLERLAKAGFGFIILFDADCVTNKNVLYAQYKLAHQLAKFKVPVYIGTGLWSVDEGKGMDDYINNYGGDRFKREVMGKVIDLKQWERQFEQDQSKDKYKSQGAFAHYLAGLYRIKMAWNVQNKSWYWYEAEDKKGTWGKISEEEALCEVLTELRKIREDFSYGFVAGVLKILKGDLKITHWEVRPGYICLEDCVLDINTLKTHSHEPGYRMLTQLPFKWADREIGCEPIKDWLLEFCEGRHDWVEVIRAGINATVTERGGKMQRFMELIGAGGTGKGTLLRLVQALLGKDNYAITTLKQLEKNRFESAMFYGKRALFITDGERYAGEVNNLKTITGDDYLRLEQKGVQQNGCFKFAGTVWVAANEAIQSSDYTNALARRRLSLSSERVIPPSQRRDLEQEFNPYLPGLLAWVLEMNTEDVKRFFVDTSNTVPSLATFSQEVLLETNPLANWADEHLYHAPGNRARVGSLQKSADHYLYPNYVAWAVANGVQPVSMQRFSKTLENLLKTQVGINAKKGKDRKGAYVSEIALRLVGDTSYPLLITGDEKVVSIQSPASDGFEGSDTLVQSQKLLLTTPTATATSPPPKADNTFVPPPEVVREEQLGIETEYLPSQSSEPSPEPVIESITEVKLVNTTSPEVVTKVEKPGLISLLLDAWSNLFELGQVVLKADEEELQEIAASLTPKQLAHIKSAANQAWRPGFKRDALYKGERVEIMEVGQGREVRVKFSHTSGSVIKVKRGDLQPWLGSFTC